MTFRKQFYIFKDWHFRKSTKLEKGKGFGGFLDEQNSKVSTTLSAFVIRKLIVTHKHTVFSINS